MPIRMANKGNQSRRMRELLSWRMLADA